MHNKNSSIAHVVYSKQPRMKITLYYLELFEWNESSTSPEMSDSQSNSEWNVLSATYTHSDTHTHTADEQLNEDTIKSNGEKQKVCGK